MGTITSRQFREKQREYLDLVDQGEKVIITRHGKTYIITPVKEEDYFTPQMIEKINQSIKQVKEGKMTRVKGTDKEIDNFVESLK